MLDLCADTGSFQSHTLIIGETRLNAIPYTHFPDSDYFQPFRASAEAFVPWILQKFNASFGQPPDYAESGSGGLAAEADGSQRRRLIATCIVRLDSSCRRLMNMDEIMNRFEAWNITATVHALDEMSLAAQVRMQTSQQHYQF